MARLHENTPDCNIVQPQPSKLQTVWRSRRRHPKNLRSVTTLFACTEKHGHRANFGTVGPLQCKLGSEVLVHILHSKRLIIEHKECDLTSCDICCNTWCFASICQHKAWLLEKGHEWIWCHNPFFSHPWASEKCRCFKHRDGRVRPCVTPPQRIAFKHMSLHHFTSYYDLWELGHIWTQTWTPCCPLLALHREHANSAFRDPQAPHLGRNLPRMAAWQVVLVSIWAAHMMHGWCMDDAYVTCVLWKIVEVNVHATSGMRACLSL